MFVNWPPPLTRRLDFYNTLPVMYLTVNCNKYWISIIKSRKKLFQFKFYVCVFQYRVINYIKWQQLQYSQLYMRAYACSVSIQCHILHIRSPSVWTNNYIKNMLRKIYTQKMFLHRIFLSIKNHEIPPPPIGLEIIHISWKIWEDRTRLGRNFHQ